MLLAEIAEVDGIAKIKEATASLAAPHHPLQSSADGSEFQHGIVELGGATMSDGMLNSFHHSEQVRTGIRLALAPVQSTAGGLPGPSSCRPCRIPIRAAWPKPRKTGAVP